MDELLTIAVLLLLALPVIAIAALVMTLRTRRQLDALQARLVLLEAARPSAPDIRPPDLRPSAAPAEPPPPLTPPASAPPTPPLAPLAAPPPRPAAAAPAVAPAKTWEEKFGTQWVVWIGGLALALGAIFLVRYSIEQGLLGPGVRIALAAAFAAALILAGEWTRRSDIAAGIGAVPGQHIPGILTAAGTIAAYATVYAAFALYDFLSPQIAFLLLGVVALATLAAALLHGPALAGLGLVGAFVTPVLVPSDDPNYWALYVYLAVVTAAAFALARMRMWRWLAITAVILGALWTLPGIDDAGVEALGAHLFHVIAGYALAAALIVSGLLYGPDNEPERIDEVSSGALAAYLVAATALVVAGGHAMPALAAFTILIAATVAIAWRTPAALWALPVAGLAVLAMMAQWAAPVWLDPLMYPAGVTRDAFPDELTGNGAHLALGAGFAALFGLAGFAAQGRARIAPVALIWSAVAAAVPVAILIALYLRITEFDRSIPFAALALLLAALYAVATENLARRPAAPGLAGATAIFATGAIAALALTLTFALEKGWLTVALALMVPGVAWIGRQRPLPALRYLAAALVALVMARIGYEPRIVGDAVGTTPVFNWLLYGYGVPAAGFWYAGHLLRQRADDAPARVVEAAAILFTVLLAALEIRHWASGGDIYRDTASLAEIGTQVSAGLAIAIGLERLRLRSGGIVHDIGALVVAALTLAAILIGLGVAANPLHTGEPVGGAVFNLVLLGYGIPAVLATVLALVARASRPLPYRWIATGAAVALAVAYVTLEVRRLYHGPVLTGATTDAEQYTYSAAWLLLGVVLLAAGVLLQSKPARLASAAVVALTIGKVFLIDMADLTGIFRALSFIGLGVVLVGIGWLYQRLLFPARTATTAGGAGTETGNE